MPEDDSNDDEDDDDDHGISILDARRRKQVTELGHGNCPAVLRGTNKTKAKRDQTTIRIVATFRRMSDKRILCSAVSVECQRGPHWAG